LNIGYEKSNVFLISAKSLAISLDEIKSKYANYERTKITVIDTASAWKSQFSIKKMSHW
jgi:hypothetical protein